MTPGQLTFLRDAAKNWRRTARGKLICPVCEHVGWPNGTWILRHVEHEECACGSWVGRGLLAQHRGSMTRHGHPCPEMPA